MLRRFIRWLFIWAFQMDITKLIKECVYVQMKELVDTGKLNPSDVPVDVKLKCTIRKYVGGVWDAEGKLIEQRTLESHSICDGAALNPQQAREKMGVKKLISTTEEMHLV